MNTKLNLNIDNLLISPMCKYNLQNNGAEHIQTGDVIRRRLNTFKIAFHFGIVIAVTPEISIMDFNQGYTAPKKLDLPTFMDNEVEFWLIKYQQFLGSFNFDKYVFSVAERVNNASSSTFSGYDIVNNHCEDFVNRCVFEIDVPSSQISALQASGTFVGLLMMTAFASEIPYYPLYIGAKAM